MTVAGRFVVPAKAGTQGGRVSPVPLGPRFRGGDASGSGIL